jgi:hypothetical protein
MNKNKIILTLIILFVLLLIGELIYLLYGSKLVKLNKTADKGVFVPSAKTSSNEYKKLATTAEPAINPKMFERLKNYVKSPESRLSILSEQTTTVLEVATEGANVEDRRDGKLYPGKIYFPYAVKLANKVMPEGYIWFFFHEPVMKKTSVFIRSKGGSLTKAGFKDIRVGDIISTVEKWDPSVEPDMNNLQETLAKQVIEYTIYIER